MIAAQSENNCAKRWRGAQQSAGLLVGLLAALSSRRHCDGEHFSPSSNVVVDKECSATVPPGSVSISKTH